MKKQNKFVMDVKIKAKGDESKLNMTALQTTSWPLLTFVSF